MSQQQPPPGHPGYGHQPPPGPGPPPPPPPPGGPPYGPPPGYGSPPYGPPPGGRGTSKGLIVTIVVGVLVVVGGGVAAAVLLLGGGDDSSSSSPDGQTDSGALAVANAYAQAWRDQDCDAFYDLITERFRAQAEGQCDPSSITGDVGEPTITEESADQATAELVMTESGVETTIELMLVNEGGEWRIEGIGAAEAAPQPESSDGAASSSSAPDGYDGAVELSTGTYEQTAASFVEALRQQDCAAVDALSTPRRRATTSCAQLTTPIGADWGVGDPLFTSEGDDGATATIPLDADGTEVPITVDIVDRNGRWLVDSVDITNLQ